MMPSIVPWWTMGLPKRIALAQELQGFAYQRQSKIAIREWQRCHCFLHMQHPCRLRHKQAPLRLVRASVYLDTCR